MSGKYNTQHPMRGNSRYPERLQKRGLSSKSVRMYDLETLRRLQHATMPSLTMDGFPDFEGKRNNWRRRDED